MGETLMSKITHIVVAYDHATKSFSYDDDGTTEWITKLFVPPSNTWCDEAEDYIADDDELLVVTVSEFRKLIEGKN
jgi:hypothetical protein